MRSIHLSLNLRENFKNLKIGGAYTRVERVAIAELFVDDRRCSSRLWGDSGEEYPVKFFF
ncbi:hypothetical protein [Oxynema aestuarii]|uniref:Uncharacterized protein n=1 Tax=Oxynema aestuarii AP17 TaxID=2064643 RepID=A0A6H1TVL6_9CYAN|nr:hypothetical protein [Oxynema aestuarii]QIZ69793.1 hypothetical protein HCG48_03705 [Oxynema aestuarii AP17]